MTHDSEAILEFNSSKHGGSGQIEGADTWTDWQREPGSSAVATAAGMRSETIWTLTADELTAAT